MILALLPYNFRRLFTRARISEVLLLALQSALMWPTRPQRKHYVVGVALLSLPSHLQTFVLPIRELCRGLVKAFLPFSIFTFYELVTTGIVIAGLFVQISNHWSGTTGAAVDDCHKVRPHLCIVWEQMLRCCQLFLKICETHGEKNSKSSVFG